VSSSPFTTPQLKRQGNDIGTQCHSVICPAGDYRQRHFELNLRRLYCQFEVGWKKWSPTDRAI